MIKRSLQFVRFAHCKGCGSPFHNENSGEWGFRQAFQDNSKPSIKEKLAATKLADIYKNLSQHQIQALQFTPPELEIEPYSSAQVLGAHKIKKKQEKFDKYCRPCIDSQDGRAAPVSPSLYNTLNKIPKDARVVHVIDALDFPASVEPSLLGRPDTHYVISRADLVVSHPNQLNRFKEYAMDQLFTEKNIPASRVHIVSVPKKWGIGGLVESLGNTSYFVGKTNAGKSSLAAFIGNEPLKTWPLPFKTQFPQEFSFGDRKLIDTPSIPETSGPGIFSIFKPNHLRKIVNGKKLLNKQGRFNIEPTVAKPGQTVSLGGLVAIEVPESTRGNATHVWAIHGVAGPLVTRTYGSIDKIKEVAASTHQAHKGWSMTEMPQAAEMLPLFEADARSLALVVRGLGPVFLKSYGKYHEPNMVKVSALPGVEVYQRKDILPWLLYRPSKREPFIKST